MKKKIHFFVFVLSAQSDRDYGVLSCNVDEQDFIDGLERQASDTLRRLVQQTGLLCLMLENVALEQIDLSAWEADHERVGALVHGQRSDLEKMFKVIY